MQRKLLTYLRENTDNQYFISTHSAALLDADGANVYHVAHDGSASYVTLVEEERERHAVCTSLGYRPSDLLQANCVIWVEGPSDRYYLRHWIFAVAPDLLEGVHYSIMFYGGRLLSHLTVNDEVVDDFIGLQRLNRRVVVVMDSDRANEQDVLNATRSYLINGNGAVRSIV
jgi:predicted ATP-dependent endonuclease of OLD family